MQLSDLFFWTDCRNRVGFKNIGGDELAALLAASGLVASPYVGQGAAAHDNTPQPISNGGIIQVAYSVVDYDDLGFFNLGADATRITIPDLDPPIQAVVIGGRCRFNNNATGTRALNFRRNGAVYNFVSGVGIGGNQTSDNVPSGSGEANPGTTVETSLTKVTAGDFFTLQGHVASITGATQDLLTPGFWISVFK